MWSILEIYFLGKDSNNFNLNLLCICKCVSDRYLKLEVGSVKNCKKWIAYKVLTDYCSIFIDIKNRPMSTLLKFIKVIYRTKHKYKDFVKNLPCIWWLFY